MAFAKHKTLYVVLFWLITLALALFTVEGEDLALILRLAGWVSLSYVGIAKIADIAKAARAPSGQFGFDQIPFYGEKYWWVVMYWCAILVTILILRFINPAALLPVSDCVFFSGALSAAYAGLHKGAGIAAQAGTGDAPRKGSES